jgi:hypothetical protein
MLKEMPELRAPENRRIGIEINPKVRYPDHTEAAIVHSTIVLPASYFLERARAHRVVSLDQLHGFYAPDFVQLSKLKAGYLAVTSAQQLGMVFTPLVHTVGGRLYRAIPSIAHLQ